MPSLTYKEVYSRFFRRVEAYDLVYTDMTEKMKVDYLSDLLHMACSYPYIRRLFTSLVLHDEEYDDDYLDYGVDTDLDYGRIEYEMVDEWDEVSDEYFVLDVLAFGMMIEWLTPKVNSLTNIVQLISTSDQKFYSQAAHLEELRGLLEDAEVKQSKIIRDRGYINNSYVDGTLPVRRSSGS